MKRINTSAWVIHKGDIRQPGPAVLREESFSFPGIDETELLVEPLYGSWEGNMSHALERVPVDICRLRGEERVVVGNSGVVRVLKPGASVKGIREGDVGVLVPIGQRDKHGFLKTVFGYDAPKTVGMLAKRTKLKLHQFIPLGETRHDLRRWAAFSVRYANAWSNWEVASACWKQQMGSCPKARKFVCAWGGGVSLAQVTLAQSQGWQAAMVVSTDRRVELLKALGVQPVDRRAFLDLHFDPEGFEANPSLRRKYFKAEWAFRSEIMRLTGGEGVSIFVDNIGTPVFQATLKVLASQGVVTTCGWKLGTAVSANRARECMQRHVHVFTHGSTYEQGVAAMRFAEAEGWLPEVPEKHHRYPAIPILAEQYARGEIESYFPIFEVNPE